MSETLKRAVQAAMLRLLDPLVKLLLEAGIGVGEFTRLVKIAYVRAAREQGRAIAGEMQRPNASRISVVTGLTRVEVAAILADEDAEPAANERGRQRAERVLSGWWNDPEFQTETGEPAPLPIKGKRRSFAALCFRYNGERRPIAILDELLRVRAVRRMQDGRVQAISRTYATVRWDPDGIAAVGEHVREQCETLVHNLKHPHHPRFVWRVVNAQLDPRYAPMLVRDLEEQARAFADSADDALNAPQYTLKPGREEGLRLGIGFYLIEESAGDAQSQPEETPDAKRWRDRASSPRKRRKRSRGA